MQFYLLELHILLLVLLTMIDTLSFIAMSFSILGNILLIRKIIWVFPLWIIANVLWIIVNLMTIPNWSQIVMFVFYTVLSIISWYNWKK